MNRRLNTIFSGDTLIFTAHKRSCGEIMCLQVSVMPGPRFLLWGEYVPGVDGYVQGVGMSGEGWIHQRGQIYQGGGHTKGQLHQRKEGGYTYPPDMGAGIPTPTGTET